LYIEKIRPIDKQLAYQVDKLLRATAKAQAAADTDAGAAAAAGDAQAAAGGDDALQYRPNPKALISKMPLVGDTAGEDTAPAEGSLFTQHGHDAGDP
jgi:U3 small nucleolar RNA-associated protein 3